MHAKPGQTIYLSAADCPPGLVGTIQVTVRDLSSDVVLIPYTTLGIVEETTGNYVATITIPEGALPGDYLAYWDTGDGDPFPDLEPIEVDYVGPFTSMTFAELREAVLAGSFSPGRFTADVGRYLNAGVTETCKRMRWQRGQEILEYTANGLVLQPVSPFWRVEEMYLASADANGDNEQAIARYATVKVDPLPTRSPAGMGNSSTPMFYIVRRDGSSAPRIVVMPATTAGKIALTGLRRPRTMIADLDASGLGDDMDRGLIAYAKARCFEREDDFEAAQYWNAQWEGCMTSGALETQDDGPYITPGTWGDGELAIGGV